MVSFTALDDPDREDEERFDLRLVSASSGVTVAVGSVVTVTIEASDQPVPTVSLDPVNPSVNEGDSVVVYAVLSGAQVDAVEVLLEITDVTASGSDYITPTTLLGTILPGETRVSFELTATVDRIYEGVSDETLTLSLRVPSGAIQVSGGVQTLRIIDSDPVPTVSLVLSSDSVLEGTGVTVSAELVGAFAEDVEVLLEVVDGTAEFADYMTPSTLRVPLSAGSTSVAYVLTAAVDGLYEGFVAETLSLRVSVFGLGGLITSSVQTLRILDVDEVTIGFQETTYRIDEDQDAVLRVAVLVGTLAPGVDLSLTYETRDDSAYASTDYTATMGTLLLSSASTVQDITVPVIDDVISELEERLTVELTAVISDPRVTVAPSVSEILIGDNDPVAGFQIVPIVPVTEGETFTVEVVLDSVSASTVTVTLGDALSGTSKAGDDYSLPGILTATIAVDELTATFRITTLSDELYEGDETLVLRASTDVVGGIVEVRATILDEDVAPRVVFERATSTVAEGSSVSVLVVLAGVLSESDIEVDFMVSGTAVEGTDYAPLGRSVTIPSGAGTGTIVLSTLDDSVYVGGVSETVVLVLTGASGGVMLGESVTHTVTIIDDELAPVVEPPVVVDVTATLSVTSVMLPEGETRTLEIVLTDVASEDVTFTLVPVSGTVDTDDYRLTPTVILIGAGDDSATVSLFAVDDSDREDERFVLELRTVSSGVVVGVSETVTVTIIDDDETPVVPELPEVLVVTATLRVSELSVSEGDTATLNIELSEPASEDVTLTLTVVSGGSADVMVDYEPLLVPVVIRAGLSELTVSIRTIDDELTEETETFVLELSVVDGPAVTGAMDRVTVTITDDDPVPTVSLELSSESVTEGSVVTVSAELSGAYPAPVEVLFEIVGVSADLTDYSIPLSLRVTIPAGDTLASFELTATVDGLYEVMSETLELRLRVPSNAVQVTGGVQTLTIVDTDSEPTVSLDPVNPSVNEGDSVVVYAVLSGAQVDAVEVLLEITDVTASGSDYITPTTLLGTILPGETRVSFELTATVDRIYEGVSDETLTLSLRVPSGAIQVSGGVQTLRIIDSDPVPTVSLVLSSDSVLEGTGVTVSAELVGAFAEDVEVLLEVVDGTAEFADYMTPSTLRVPLSAGSTSVAYVLTAAVDGLYEGFVAETLSLRVSVFGLGGLITSSVQTLRILDVDEVTIGFQETTYRIDEDQDAVLRVAVLVGTLAPGVDLSLTYETRDDSAYASTDYTATVGTLLLSSASTVQDITVPVIDDVISELEERLTVELTAVISDPRVTVAPSVSEILIGDNDPVAGFQIVPIVPVTEGETFTVEVVLDSVSASTVTVTLGDALSGTSKAGDDYSLPGILTATIAVDELTATFRITTLSDELYEGDETLVLRASTDVVGGIVEVRATILDEDVAPRVVFERATSTVAEGSSVSVLVVLAGVLSESDIEVDFMVSGTAVEGTDYAPLGRSVTILSGAGTGTIVLSTLDDSVYVGGVSETVVLVLTGASGGVMLGESVTHTVTIIDDELAPVVEPPVVVDVTATISPLNVPLSEGESQTLEIVLESAASVDVTLTLVLENEVGAVTARDYSLTPTAVFIGAGMTSAVVSLLALDDSDREGEERFDLRLVSASSGVTVAVRSVVTVTIEASDQPVDITPGVDVVTATLRVSSETVSEGDSETLYIELSEATTEDVTVTLTVTGTATGDVDYSLLPLAPYVLTAGETELAVGISTVVDGLYEREETIEFVISTLSGPAVTGAVDRVTVTIVEEVPTVSLALSSESVIEGGIFTVTVRLSGPVGFELRITELRYVPVGSTAEMADYVVLESLQTGEIRIAAGMTTAVVTFQTRPDGIYEGTEILVLRPYALGGGLNLEGRSGEIAIRDADLRPTVSLESPGQVAEGGSITVIARLNGAALETPLAVTVAVNTVASRINDISPVISPDEYQLIPLVSVIPAGELTATFRLETYHDGRFRGDRTLEIDLVTDNDQVVLAGGPMQVELMERDMVPVLSLDPIPDVLDTRGSFLIEVNLSNLLDNDLDLELTTGLVEGSYIAFLRLIDPVERGRVAITGIPIGLQTGLITFRPQNVASDQTVTLALQLDDDAIKNADLNELEALGLIELGVTSRTFRILDRDVKPVLSLDPVGTIAEGSTNEVTVRLDRPLISDLTVSLTIDSAATLALDRPAEEGDYELPSTSFVIPASALLTTFSLKSIDDDIYEGDEQFVLRLEHEPIDTDQFDLGQDTQIVTIRDGDPPELILDEVVSPVNEGDSFNLTGQLRGARVLPITLSLNTSSAASTVGSDEWSVTPQTITVPAGNQTYPFSFTVTVKEDSVYEGTERAVFEVTAVGASERVLNRERFGLVEINDTNETPEISRITIPEGVTEGETFTVVVELDDALGTYLDVSLVHDGASTAEPKDYQITPPIYRIEAGQTIATLEVEIFDDRLYELTETLVFSITASNTEARIELPMLSRSIEITESEELPRIVLRAIDNPITEGGDGVTVTVRVNGAFEVPLTLSLTTAVTSVAGTDDYSLSPETIVIPAGYKQEDVRENSGNVRVEVEFILTADTDDLYEGPEELILDLIVDTSADPRIDLNRGTFRRATTIMDVNPPGVDVVTATLRVSSETVSEGDSETLYIELSEATTEDVMVTLTVTGTATGDVDYSLLPLAPYVLTAGETELAVGISTVVDGLYEREETIEFVISTLSGPAVTGAVDRVTVTIVEEVPTVSLALSSESVIEGGIFTGTVRLSGPVGFELRITELRYVPVGSTAEMADYVVLESLQTGEIRIAAGMTTAVVTFQTRPDGIYEGTEILVLRPYALGGGLNLEGRSGEIAIRDADLRPTVSLESPGQVAEGGSITVIARLDGALESTVTVELVPTNGNAESDDYTISPASVTILPGDTAAKFTLNARPDIIPTFETTETLTLHPVAIIVEGSVSLDTDSSSVPHEVMISESLPVPEVTLGVQGPSGFDEDQRGIQIEVNVQPLTEFTVTVTLSRRADSTAGDTDFELETNTLEIDPDIGFLFFNLDIIDDVLYELTETLNLEGYATGGGIELPVQALETTIIDNDSLPTLRLVPVGEVTEGHSTTIEVYLTNGLTTAVRVSLAYGVGSTASQSDYTLSEIDAEIAAGELTATFSLTADQNRFYEIDEQLVLVPSASGVGQEELTGEPGVVTIVDDETQPILELDRIDDIRESAAAFPDHYIPVRLIGDPLETGLSYDLAFGGSAIMGEDYLGLTVDVIDAGQQSGGFVIRVGDDNSVGVDEPVLVVVSVTVDEASLYLVEQGFVKLGVLTRSFYILDLSSQPLLSLGSVVDVEDSSASRPGTVREGSSGIFTVDLDSTFNYPLTATLTIRPTDSGGTTDRAELDDYRLFYLTDTVTIPTNSGEIIFTIPANSQRVMFTLEAIDNNTVYERDETLVLELSADGEAVDLGVTRRVVTIQDNDPTPTIRFVDEISPFVNEGGVVMIPVQVVGSASYPQVLDLRSARVSSQEGPDHSEARFVSNIPANSRGKRFAYSLISNPDNIYKGTERYHFELILRDGNGVVQDRYNGFVDIIDDEPIPTLSLDPVEDVTEGGVFTVTVRLSGPVGFDLPITELRYVSAGSTAEMADYVVPESLQTGELMIAAGMTTAVVTFQTRPDGIYEGTETLVLRPYALSGGLSLNLEGRSGEIAIRDADLRPTVSLESPGQVDEGGSITVIARLDGVLESTATVELVPTNGNAESDDYTISPTKVTILPGDRDAEFTLTARADIIPTFETIETLTLHPVAIIVEGSVSLDTDSSSVPHEVMISESLPVPEVILGVQGPSGFDEDQRGIQIEASVQPLTEFTVTVMLSRRADSTAVDTDFELDASTLEIDPDIGSVFFNLDIIDDVFYELIETLNFEGYATGVGIELPVQALETTIINNDPRPTLQISPVGEFTEGHSTTIEVSLTSILEVPVRVSLAYGVSSTASQSDYTLSEIDAEIAAGELTATFSLTADQNRFYEIDEQLILVPSASGPGQEELTGEPGVVTIVDDETQPILELDRIDDIRESAAAFPDHYIPVRLIGDPLETGLSYDLAFGGSAIMGEDYQGLTVDVIDAGQQSGGFVIRVGDDNSVGVDDPVSVVISVTVDEASLYLVEQGFVKLGVLTRSFYILDLGSQPLLSLGSVVDVEDSSASRPGTVREGSSGIFTVDLDSTFNYPLTATLTIRPTDSGGTTDPAELDDYRLFYLTDTVRIPTNSREIIFTIPTNSQGVTFTLEAIDNNMVYERDKTLVLELNADTETVDLGIIRRVVTIQDNDPAPTLRVGEVGPLLNEGESLTFTVEVVGSAIYTQTLTFEPDFLGGEGRAETADLKFPGTNFTAVIPADRDGTSPIRRFEFTLTANEDNIYEGIERFDFDLILRDGNGVDQDRYDGFVNIIDNDVVEVGFDSATYSVPENAGGVTITVNTSGRIAEGVNLSVEFEYVRGTASETEDYVAPLTLDVPLSAGATRATLFVEIVNDDLYENADTFSVRLVEPEGELPFGVELVTGMTEATVTITNDDEIEIGFVKGMYTFPENQRQGTVQVRYSGSQIASGVEVLVYYTTTVVMGDSFNLMDLSGNLVISSNKRVYDINVGIMDDNEFNFVNDEYEMSLSLLDMNDGLSLESGKEKAGLNVITDDVLDFGFSVTDYEVNEASGTVELEVSVLRNRIAAGARVVVSYSTTPGSATSESRPDFEPVTGELILSSTSTVVTFAIPIVNDDVFEGSESFVVTLKKADGRDTLRLSPSEATVTINDNESLPTLSLDGPTEINEGDVFTITVRLSHEIQDAAVLIPGLEPLSTGTAGTSDISSVSGFSRIRAGDTTIDLIYRAIQDEVYEGTEILVLRPSGFVRGVFTSLDAVSSEIIIIDDDHVEIGFDPSAYSVDEDSGTLTLTARLLGGTLAPGVDLLVDYATRDGSAYAGTDYTTEEGTLLFNSVTLSRQITIAVIDDVISEGGESLTVELTTSVSYQRVTLAPSEATVLIVDDESATVFRIVPIMPVTEGETLTVEVVLDYVSNATVTVTLEDALSGNAKAGDDYTLPGMLTATIAVGDLTATFRITTLSDELYEGAETLDLLASTDVVAGIVESRATILDEDVAPRVIFDQRSSRVAEGLTVSVLVVLEGSLSESEIVVDFTVSGTAIEGTDYRTLGRSVTIPSGSVTSTVVLGTIDDSEYVSEMVVLVLTGASGGVTLGESVTHAVTIIDDDTVVIGFRPYTYTVVENAGEVELTVEVISGMLTETVTLSYRTLDGTATAPTDYTDLTDVITLSSLMTSVTFRVPIIDDLIPELTEQFSVALSVVGVVPVGVRLEPSEARVTITDTDTVVIGFRPYTYTVVENAGEVTLTVEVISGVLPGAVTLSYRTLDGTATAPTDYTDSTNVITLSSLMTSVTFRVPIIDDLIPELTEQFSVALSVVGVLPVGVTLEPSEAGVTITDTDTVVIGFRPYTYTVVENAGEVALTVEVISGVLPGAVTLSYRTLDGTATAPTDYTDSTDMITLSSLMTSVTFRVPIIDDLIPELTEQFSVALSVVGVLPVGVTLEPSEAGVTITDTDTVVIGFRPYTYTVVENAGEVTLTVEVISGVLPAAVTLSYRTLDGTATAPTDYTDSTDMITLSSLMTSVTFRVPIIDDLIPELTEQFSVALSVVGVLPVGVRLEPSEAGVTITDTDTVVIGFRPYTYTVVENAGEVTLTVEVISGVLPGTVTLSYRTLDGTATAPTDYTDSTDVITLSSLMTSVTFRVPIIDDLIPELTEQFSVALSVVGVLPVGVRLEPSEAGVTITDTDTVVIGFRPYTYTVVENAGEVTLTVEVISGVLPGAVTLSYRTLDGTATAPTDYTDSTDMITLSSLMTSVTFRVPIIDDLIPELTEQFSVALSVVGVLPVGVRLEPSEAGVTITDTDTVVIGFRPYTYTVVENAGEVTLTVEVISGVLPGTVTLSYRTLDGTATAPTDYTDSTDMITLSSLMTSVTFRVPIIDDLIPELTEQFSVALSVVGVLPVGVRLEPSEAGVTITDTDTVVIGFRPYTYTVVENAGEVTLTVEVISGVLPGTVTLSYRTLDGTATAPTDYTDSTDMITLSSLMTSVTFRVPIIDDLIPELTEQFSVALSVVGVLPVGVRLEPSEARVTILDDDTVVIGFRPYTYTVVENAGEVELTVEVISGVLPGTVTLSYRTLDGTATAPTDYTDSTDVITLSSVDTSVTFRVPIIDDLIPELTEQFSVALSVVGVLPVGVRLEPSEAGVTITDTDTVVIGFRPYTYTVVENAGEVELTVEVISGVLPGAVTLSYRTLDGTATAPTDYTDSTDVITLSSVDTSVTFRVPIIDDLIPELTEQFSVALSVVGVLPVGVRLEPSEAGVTITDTDTVVIGFRPYTYTVVENAGEVELTVEVISGVLPGTVTLSYRTLDGTATAPTDYTDSTDMITLSSLMTSVTFRVPIIDDLIPELTEQFSVALSVVGVVPVGVRLEPSEAGVTITDTDTVVIGFRPYTYTVVENAGEVELTVEVISGVLPGAVTLSYRTLDGTATAPTDYTDSTDMITLSSLMTSVTFRVPIIDDLIPELTEQFSVALSVVGVLPVGVRLEPSEARVTILDDDTVVIGFRPYTYTVVENAGEVELTVEVISGVLPGTVTLSYRTLDGTATAPTDYTDSTDVITLSSVDTSVTFRVPIIDDLIPELTEQFSVALSVVGVLPVGVRLEPSEAGVTITDTDTVVIGFRPYTYTVVENAGEVDVNGRGYQRRSARGCNAELQDPGRYCYGSDRLHGLDGCDNSVVGGYECYLQGTDN